MAAPTAAFTVIPLSDVDPDSPIVSGLMDSLRLNDQNLFAQLVGDPVSSPTFTAAAEHDHDGVNSKVVDGADFILVKKKLITSDVTSVTFSGLNGDVDEVYKIVGRIKQTGGVQQFELRPNGITAGQSSVIARFHTSAPSSDVRAAISRLILADDPVVASPDVTVFDAIFWARKVVNSVAMNRMLISHFHTSTTTSVPALAVGSAWSTWDDDSTNVTSLDVVSTIASDIRDGSTIALYKLRQV